MDSMTGIFILKRRVWYIQKSDGFRNIINYKVLKLGGAVYNVYGRLRHIINYKVLKPTKILILTGLRLRHIINYKVLKPEKV